MENDLNPKELADARRFHPARGVLALAELELRRAILAHRLDDQRRRVDGVFRLALAVPHDLARPHVHKPQFDRASFGAVFETGHDVACLPVQRPDMHRGHFIPLARHGLPQHLRRLLRPEPQRQLRRLRQRIPAVVDRRPRRPVPAHLRLDPLHLVIGSGQRPIRVRCTDPVQEIRPCLGRLASRRPLAPAHPAMIRQQRRREVHRVNPLHRLHVAQQRGPAGALGPELRPRRLERVFLRKPRLHPRLDERHQPGIRFRPRPHPGRRILKPRMRRFVILPRIKPELRRFPVQERRPHRRGKVRQRKGEAVPVFHKRHRKALEPLANPEFG